MEKWDDRFEPVKPPRGALGMGLRCTPDAAKRQVGRREENPQSGQEKTGAIHALVVSVSGPWNSPLTDTQ
ncbi:DUF6192 family protein [Streptomyces olivoreticuli]